MLSGCGPLNVPTHRLGNNAELSRYPPGKAQIGMLGKVGIGPPSAQATPVPVGSGACTVTARGHEKHRGEMRIRGRAAASAESTNRSSFILSRRVFVGCSAGPRPRAGVGARAHAGRLMSLGGVGCTRTRSMRDAAQRRRGLKLFERLSPHNRCSTKSMS